MLVNALTIAGSVMTGLAVPTFGYLKYRAYTQTVRHVVDKLGIEGLERANVILPPRATAKRLPSQDPQKQS